MCMRGALGSVNVDGCALASQSDAESHAKRQQAICLLLCCGTQCRLGKGQRSASAQPTPRTKSAAQTSVVSAAHVRAEHLTLRGSGGGLVHHTAFTHDHNTVRELEQFVEILAD